MKYSHIWQESAARVASDSTEFGLSFCFRTFENNQKELSGIDDIALFTGGKELNFDCRRPKEAREQGAGSGKRETGSIWEGAAGAKNKEGDSLLFITGYYSVKNTHRAKFWNFHLTSTNAQKKIWKQEKVNLY